jgi:hypothetical protein
MFLLTAQPDAHAAREEISDFSTASPFDARTAARRAVPILMPLLGTPQEVAEESRFRQAEIASLLVS